LLRAIRLWMWASGGAEVLLLSLASLMVASSAAAAANSATGRKQGTSPPYPLVCDTAEMAARREAVCGVEAA
jgi:hypothetical protein